MGAEVDVVIPYSPEHTEEELLERAKGSVEEQTVDTNVIVREDPGGVAHARNKGIEQSERQYVAFLDADDYWKPEKLERQLRRIEEAEAGICLTKSKDAGSENMNNPVRSDTESFVRDVFLSQIVGFTSTILVDTEQVDTRFDEDLYRLEDHWFVMQATDEADICFVDEPLVILEKHDAGLSSTEDHARKMQSHQEIYDRATDLYPFLERYRREYWRENYHRIGRQYYYDGEYTKSIRHLLASLRYKPTVKTAGALGISLVNYFAP